MPGTDKGQIEDRKGPTRQNSRTDEGQNLALRKYGFKTHDPSILDEIKELEKDSPESFRRRLTGIEGKFSEYYFNAIFQLLPEKIRPKTRKTFLAYDGTNNIFNLAYEVLSWKVHRALIKAKVEPYLGFLHSVQYGKPSLICDFLELYRSFMDSFVLDYSRELKPRDFILKEESMSRTRKGKRQYPKEEMQEDFFEGLGLYFEKELDIPRVNVGKRQEFESLISEEALQLARFLRTEVFSWTPRIL